MPIHYSNTEWNGKKVIVGETELDGGRDVNLLLGFHGADSTPENIMIQGNRLQVKNTVMVFPEGPVNAGKGLWSWWEDGPRQKEAVKKFLDFTTQTIDAAHRHLDSRVSGARTRTCLWGFSQGGAASLVYALLGSRPLHKVASVCGFLPELDDGTESSKPPVTILGIYGANDEVVPAFLADYALEEMKNRGHRITIKETPQAHELNSENLQDLSDFFGS